MNFEIDPQPPSTSKSWYLWVGLIGFLLLVFPVACCGGIALWGMGEIKAPLEAAAKVLNADPEVTEKLGTPIVYDNVAVSNYRVENGAGSTQFNTTFSGPEGKANVDGYMELRDGQWQLGNLTIRFDDGEEVYIEKVIGGSNQD